MKLRIEKVGNLGGFAMGNTQKGELASILSRAIFTSDDLEFYPYIEHFSGIFLSRVGILLDDIHRFLVVIRDDLSADVYVNDFPVEIEAKLKKNVQAGDAIFVDDIVDVRNVRFPEVGLQKDNKIIFCFKSGWRFGLFFDLQAKLPNATGDGTGHLDVEQASLDIAALYRYLSYYHVYKTLEATAQFNEMVKDGWFPFIEILGNNYKELSEIYKNKFNFYERVSKIVESFNKERIRRITEKWWENPVFMFMKNLLEAGIDAYLQDNEKGFINCIKTLASEVEGILRKMYLADTGKGDGVRAHMFIEHIVKKARESNATDHSLLLPSAFLEYLQKITFANFNTETGMVSLSRNSAGHGVAESSQYTKARALQMLLVLDQIYFYR